MILVMTLLFIFETHNSFKEDSRALLHMLYVLQVHSPTLQPASIHLQTSVCLVGTQTSTWMALTNVPVFGNLALHARAASNCRHTTLMYYSDADNTCYHVNCWAGDQRTDYTNLLTQPACCLLNSGQGFLHWTQWTCQS